MTFVPLGFPYIVDGRWLVNIEVGARARCPVLQILSGTLELRVTG